MRRLVTLIAAVIAAVALLVGGTSLAVACVGGTSGNDNAGHYQYNGTPGCGPDKTDGWAGSSGWHDGQPPKDDDRGDCPKSPCDHHSYTGNDSGDWGSSGKDDGDCRHSSTSGHLVVPSTPA